MSIPCAFEVPPSASQFEFGALSHPLLFTLHWLTPADAYGRKPQQTFHLRFSDGKVKLVPKTQFRTSSRSSTVVTW